MIKIKQDHNVQSITVNNGEICYHGRPIIAAEDNKLKFPNAQHLDIRASYHYSGDTFEKVAVELVLTVRRNDLNEIKEELKEASE